MKNAECELSEDGGLEFVKGCECGVDGKQVALNGQHPLCRTPFTVTLEL
jgi:hypothetical protein